MEMKVFASFIFLHHACVSTSKENNDISERLLVLEDMLTEMEYIVKETNIKVRKAHNKLENTEETLERDFARLQKSEERKMRKGYRQIMKGVRKELKHDSHLFNEMIRSVKDINSKEAVAHMRNLNHNKSDMEITNDKLFESLDQDTTKSEDHSEYRVMFKATKLTKHEYLEGDTMIFPEVTYNIGEGYDPRYGFFVTPLAGTYYFTIQLYMSAGFYTDICIYVDDECVAWATFTTRYHSCENLAVVVMLNIGDVVYVKQISKARPGIRYQTLSKHPFNTFSGVFIR